jgi:spectinomycin phosphotransferase
MAGTLLAEPGDLDGGELRSLLERRWALRSPRLAYLPVGFGSHHWRAVDAAGTVRFVTVDDLGAGFQAGPDPDGAFAALDRAYRTATWLRDEAGLEFVLAPLPDEEGVTLRRLDDRYAVTVSPLLEGETSEWGPWESAGDRRQMAVVLGRLHAATDALPDGLPRRDDLAIPSRAVLVDALADLDRQWHSGPFAEPTRHLLADAAADLELQLLKYDELAASVRDNARPWVITHGEPHRANVIRARDGSLHLVDWDTTLIAPRERDLRVVLDDDRTGWEEYVAVTTGGGAELNEQTIELYTRWWDLADTAIYVALFREPHERDENTIASHRNLSDYLQTATRESG